MADDDARPVTPAPTSGSKDEDPATGPVRELRLALVCYGGVSLAIYMHGITKEIQKLVEASRAFEASPDANGFEPDDVRHAYVEALAARRRADGGVVTRVVVDIVSGTSAGGINGIFLAKAMSQGVSQDSLRDLWMDRGDIRKLLGWDRLPGLWTKVAAWVATKRFKSPPLSGDRMFRWIKEALDDMDGHPEPTGPMVPAHESLELFVTTTDYRGRPRTLPVSDPALVDEIEHRHVFRFAREGNTNQFTDAYNTALTFAARSTSSFPGAFPPIDVANIGHNVPGWTDAGFLQEFFAPYVDGDTDAAASWFVDGGVLDNFPFDHAIDAIYRKPAATEVERWLLYIQPDPRVAPPMATGQPSLAKTAWAAMGALAHDQPIVDELERVRLRNERVSRVKDIVHGLWPLVEKQVADVVDVRDPMAALREDQNTWRPEMNRRAQDEWGLQYLAYTRLKLRSVVSRFAGVTAAVCGFPDDSLHAYFVRDAIAAWAEQSGNVLAAQQGESLSDAQIEFLRTFDLGFQERRIQFVLQGISELYGALEQWPAGVPLQAPTRADLDRAKTDLWDLYGSIDAGGSALSDPAAIDAVRGLFSRKAVDDAIASGDANAAVSFAAQHAAGMAAIQEVVGKVLTSGVGDMAGKLQGLLAGAIRGWQDPFRSAVITRFVGFPFWDVVVYPPQRFSDLGELYPIRVGRISPEDARMLSEEGTTKLKGISYGHFGGFLQRDWRENDYLWGRFDGAERLLHLVLGDAPGQGLRGAAPAYRDAFGAIIAEERKTLTSVGQTLAGIERRMDADRP